MFADILSQFRQTSMKPSSEQDYLLSEDPIPRRLPIVLSLSTAMIVGGMLIMINLSARSRQTLERLETTSKPQTIQKLVEQNQWSIEDRRILHEQNKRSMEDRAYLYERLEASEKTQAKTQNALENAQRSFNEARDVLRRLEQSKVKQ